MCASFLRRMPTKGIGAGCGSQCLTTIVSLGPSALFPPRADEEHDCAERADDVSVSGPEEEGQRDWAGANARGVAAIATAGGAVHCRHRTLGEAGCRRSPCP